MGKLARTSIMISAMLSFLVLTSACQTTDSQKDTGAAVGLIIGGIAGALIGSRSGGAQLGAALGGIAGSVAGAMIGAKLDEADRIAADEARTTALAATRNGITLDLDGGLGKHPLTTVVDSLHESLLFIRCRSKDNLVEVRRQSVLQHLLHRDQAIEAGDHLPIHQSTRIPDT